MPLKKCFHCGGDGVISGRTCPGCHGTGQIMETEDIGFYRGY